MGRIHPDADAIHFIDHPEHRKLLAPFLTCFDVTYAKKSVKGNDQGYVFYLSPETFIQELIGLRRELLLLYSPYDDLQPRALKLIDAAFERDRTRLDPLGSMLVADDPATQDKVAEILVDEPERPPIVAQSVAQVRNLRSADDIRELLVNQLFKRDLFGIEAPLRREVSFFGRDALVSELLHRFRAGQNSGLFGLRRIGKTSVLYALVRRCQADGLGTGAYVDVSNPTLYKARWWKTLQHLVKAMVAPLALERGRRSRVRALNVDYTEDDGAGHFTADIRTLLEYSEQGRLFLALDEIESLTFDVSPEEHWRQDFLPFWRTLRSIHQDTEGDFTFIIAGVNPHAIEKDEVSGYDNPLFSTVKEFFVPPFAYDDTRRMVRKLGRYMGLRPEESLYEQLHAEYGGHPFLVRQACSQLATFVDDRPAPLTLALFQEKRGRLALSLERNIKQILNILKIWYPSEYEALGELAGGNRDFFTQLAALSAEFTQHMEGYGLVSDPRTDPQITIGLVEDYLKREAARDSIESGVYEHEDILAEISRRRNAIEPALRKLIRNGLRFRHGEKAAQKVLDSLPEQRREVLARYSYDGLWEHTYFNELAVLIGKEWDCFQNWFGEDKSRVEGWLDHINRSRADAHAKKLEEEELAYLRLCFKQLETKLGLSG